MSKTLILTSTAPGSGGVGDIYIDNIISGVDKSKFIRVSLVKQQKFEFAPTWSGIDSKVIKIAKSHYPLVSTFYFTKFLKKELSKLADELIQFIERNSIDKVWVTLSSPEIIMLILEISRNLKVKVYSTIWDVPEYLLQNNHFDPINYKRVLNAFHVVLERSERISVIDEGMKNYLPSKLKSKSVIIRNGVTFTSSDSERNEVKDDNVIRIVFAGSIYAKKEWNAFVRSLISCDFCINGKRVELICIGRLPRFGIVKDERINFKPFMPNKDVLRILAKCDIGYVPYWFSNRKRLIVSTSFPGKIASYLSVPLKIMFHGPSVSSVSYFLDEYQVGKCCHSLDLDDIKRTIASINDLYVEEDQFRMAKEIFSKKVMQVAFERFLC